MLVKGQIKVDILLNSSYTKQVIGGESMSFKIAQKKIEFWHAYWENKDERVAYNDEQLTPQEFFEVWIDKDKVDTFTDTPSVNRRSNT